MRSLRRFGFSCLVAWTCAGGAVAAATDGLSGLSGQGGTPVVEIEARILEQLQEDSATGYAIFLRERPDLAPAYEMDWVERGRFVARELRAVAETSQQRVREYLIRSGATFRSFWIDNVIVVERSDVETFSGLTRFAEIAALRADPEVRLLEPEAWSRTGLESFSVEANIAHVRAPEVWVLGFEGQGLVVANIDSGVRYTHEALVERYRGSLGGGVFDHHHNWWDPGGNTVAYDDHGHGTHVMGTAVGDDGDQNRIGMAPEARWIACKGCLQSGGCLLGDLFECAEFMAAPWDLNGENAAPDRRPHVVNNSWGNCQQFYAPFFQGVVDAWQAAGIMPVFANGNASNCGLTQPPACGTVGNPARYANVLGVGSTGQNDGLYAIHSLKGPTDDPWKDGPLGYATIKPNVVAPGVAIRSAVSSGDDDYLAASGTSMSAPHVTGMVALLWAAAPCLLGDYSRTVEVLAAGSTPVPFASQCGGEGPGDVPNHATGWGEIDALGVVQAGMAACVSPGRALRLFPAPLDFGAVPVTRTGGPKELTLWNTGTDPVTVSRVLVESSLPSDPEPVPFLLAGGSCGPVPFELPPDGSCTYRIQFAPWSAAGVASTLTVMSDAASSPDAVSLRGTGVGFLAFDPWSLTFGSVDVGASSSPQNAVLRNVGMVEATELTFSPPGNFQVDTDDCGDVLAPGESCPVSVVFAPADGGALEAVLTAFGDQPGALAGLNLGGYSVTEDDHPTRLLSRASGLDGPKANQAATHPSASGDGRLVTFVSTASNLHPEKIDGIQDVFLRDVQTHETLLVSRADGPAGAKGNVGSGSAVISAAGRFVAFASRASNIHPDKNDPLVWDVFVRDLLTHETLLVSRASGIDGAKGNGYSSFPSISADGRYVAFTSGATNLHSDAPAGVSAVYVRDLLTHETQLVSRASGPDGEVGDSSSLAPAISADGRFVAFATASMLDPDDNSSWRRQVYVRDLQTQQTILASRASGSGGAVGNWHAEAPTISADGRFVAFFSDSNNLDPDDLDVYRDIFVRDLQTHETILASRRRGAAGAKGDGNSSLPAISADGRFVAFTSSARNLHPHDTDSIPDVFVRDLQTHETALTSRAGGPLGAKGNGDSTRPSIAAYGRYVVFDSVATNLHPDASDHRPDVYLRDFQGPPSKAGR